MTETHIEYLSDHKYVCDVPSRLGSDFILHGIALRDSKRCEECFGLVLAHNTQEDIKEKFGSKVQATYYAPSYFPTELDWKQNIWLGFLIASFIWAIVFVLTMVF